ncbi:MAG TPA: ketopantoate reductase family protein [Kofleriaceae bacterium]|nr:ketopantoate reductase family protein [Kofleriaceae bacterium]
MPPSGPATITVVGAGGVGGLLAARLARAGNDVRLLTRGAALTAIRERGVAIHGPDGDHLVPVARVSEDAAALGPADIVLVTVKTWQLAELGPRLVPLIGSRTLVVPMQNGVEASEVLGSALGAEHVLGGVCRVISWIERPGVIRWMGAGPSLTIGARRAGQAEAVEACARTVRTGGIEVVVVDDIDRARWMKFLFIAPYAAVGAVERVPLGPLRSAPDTRARLEAVMREIAAIAGAQGVELPPDIVATTFARIDALPEDATASMHRDIVAGRPSELHELIGAVVRLGRQAGVATPVSADLYARLEPLERQARAR